MDEEQITNENNITEDRKKKKIREKELNNLKKDIEDLENEMKQNEICFNMITDEYLLDSVIYEYNAQKAKMNFSSSSPKTFLTPKPLRFTAKTSAR